MHWPLASKGHSADSCDTCFPDPNDSSTARLALGIRLERVIKAPETGLPFQLPGSLYVFESRDDGSKGEDH
ncbi:hypothetical protein TNIN_369331 [Trichonephila inaurata madagascariensis]|uniref:Uncharacterized protein n=1 Tax=Trichonephila inaurata madagascariensis TaxID=2747483 RepID=A0A8X6XZU7_9ARAC|nr:hypothetical protein TNIN_369331 [Trichonephila inaurata madagascariensis]